ncbi:flagellar filament capping protein FliD [Aestuariibacter sp. A3R04]|uniref:flagellar filament capping protein FliD n=1 Tax=Aestuariibacter sp. A3R04 TaxID=2841571 RepID=UPI001C09405C|nr:flagellar filament capping protein FliD [Aestuariibacter sp. A3R04]MBU3023133.1 flagellar filament capping protein FliD [Aestuariibacter sp. A3R04]
MSSSYLSIDPATLASQYTQIDRAAKDAALSEKYNLYSGQISAFNSLKTTMADFVTSLEDMQNDNSALVNQSAIDNETVLSVTTDSSAIAGTYDIFVEQLAQAHQIALSFDPNDALPTDGELSIDLSGDEFVVDLSTLGPGASLTDLASEINTHVDNTGVKATVMRSDSETFLVLTSEESGAANQISVGFTPGTDPAASNFTTAIASQHELTQAQDAIVQFGASSPVTIISSNNQLEDVIEGVTVDLRQAQEAGDSAVKLTVGQDLDQSEENIKSFTDQVNRLISSIKENSNLQNDPMAKSLMSQLKTAFQGTVEGKTLYSIGIEFDRFGNINIDSDRLQESLQTDPEQVAAMLTGDNGVMAQIIDSLTPYTSSYGIMSQKTETLRASLNLVIDQQERQNYIMEQRYNRYLSQFTQMQVTIAQLESSMSQF